VTRVVRAHTDEYYSSSFSLRGRGSRVVGIVLLNGEGGSSGIGEYYDGGLSAVISRVEEVGGWCKSRRTSVSDLRSESQIYHTVPCPGTRSDIHPPHHTPPSHTQGALSFCARLSLEQAAVFVMMGLYIIILYSSILRDRSVQRSTGFPLLTKYTLLSSRCACVCVCVCVCVYVCVHKNVSYRVPKL